MTTDDDGAVVAGDGRAWTLGRTLASGGAGSIHRIVEDADLVAKIYHPPIDHALYERKVEAMLTLVPDLPDIVQSGVREVQIAWPRLLLRDRQQRFVGFAMPLLDFATSIELECVMQERQARTLGLPTGLGAKVTLAANVAAVIAELHRQGHYVVDLKPVNLRFYRRSLHIAMLDCDGFSIKGRGERFSAWQFTPDYLAPEYQVRGLSVGAGDPGSAEEITDDSQDRFALAVVVFQLLNFGIHPFTGRPTSERIPTDIPGRIAQHCYAYGLRPNSRMAPNPGSGHAAMPSELRHIFDRAFGGIGMSRPSADEWVQTLRRYGQRSTGMLVACSADTRHQHFAGLPCAACARAALLTRTAAAARAKGWRGQQPTVAPVPIPVSPYGPFPAPASALPAAVPSPPAKPVRFQSPWLTPLGCLFCLLTPVLTLVGLYIKSHLEEVRFAELVKSVAAREARERANEPPAPPPPAPPRVDAVLAAARGTNEAEIFRQLRDLPAQWAHESNGAACAAAAASWRDKVKWIERDPAFAEKLGLSHSDREGSGPCPELSGWAWNVILTLERCGRRIRSPGAYPGLGETECKKNHLIQAGLATIGAALVYGAADDFYLWECMGDAFVLAGDYERALLSYVVAALVQPDNMRADGFLSPPINDHWLRRRGEILQAKALATVSAWHGVPLFELSEQIRATLDEPWPEEAPSKKPRKPPHQVR